MIVLEILALALAVVVLARGAEALRLPPLLGMILGGALVGALGLAWGEGGPIAIGDPGGLRLSDLSQPIRLAILSLVLLRAGLGISLDQLKQAGALSLRLGSLPMLGDAAAVGLASWWLLDLSPGSAAVLGCLVAAISPAIVIPGLLDLVERRQDQPRHRRVLTALLVGAPLDNILALVGLGVALDLALGETVATTSIASALFFSIALGAGVGGLVGWIVSTVLRRTIGRKTPLGPTAAALSCWGVAALTVTLAHIVDFSFVLAVLCFGMVLRHRCAGQVEALRPVLQRAWNISAYALFGLIGMAVDLGPLSTVGMVLAAVVLAGQAGRALFALLASAGSGLSRAQRGACVLAYVPKATIQAAFAAVPLDRGLEDGNLLLTVAVLAVVVTAPAGVLTLHRGVDDLLDRDTGNV